ncbi:hypothetical protein RCL1_000589 [Eukaryota sp. TZLM3-RCL]
MTDTSNSLQLSEDTDRLISTTESLCTQFREYERILTLCKKQESVLRKTLSTHEKHKKTLQNRISSVKKKADTSTSLQALHRASSLSRDVNYSLPTNASWPISYIVGKLNVVIQDRDRRFNYKMDYESFKRTFSITSFILSLVAFFLPQLSVPRVIVSAYDCTLLVFQLLFHLGLLFRESILIKNGSSINHYWIIHHYSTTILLFLLLICPFDTNYLRIRAHIAVFSMLTSLFHFIRHKQAMHRYYADLATERAHFMDVIDHQRELGVDSCEFHRSRSNYFPISGIIIGICAIAIHVYQNFIGILASSISFKQSNYDALFWTGLLLTFLGIGNCVTTTVIIISKIKSFSKNTLRHTSKSKTVPGFPNKKLTIPALHKLYAHLTENEVDSDESSCTETEEKRRSVENFGIGFSRVSPSPSRPKGPIRESRFVR